MTGTFEEQLLAEELVIFDIDGTLADIPAARAFVELALHFAQYNEKENSGYERSQNAIKLCNDIKRELRS
jgi:FMN phosphatase YigB (HAD superfamily)